MITKALVSAPLHIFFAKPESSTMATSLRDGATPLGDKGNLGNSCGTRQRDLPTDADIIDRKGPSIEAS